MKKSRTPTSISSCLTEGHCSTQNEHKRNISQAFNCLWPVHFPRVQLLLNPVIATEPSVCLTLHYSRQTQHGRESKLNQSLIHTGLLHNGNPPCKLAQAIPALLYFPVKCFWGDHTKQGPVLGVSKSRKKKKGGEKKNPKTWHIHLGRRKPFSPWHTPLWHTQLPGRRPAPPGTRRSHSGCCSTSLRGTWRCHRPSSCLWKTHTPHSTSRGAAPCSPPKNITQQWAGLSEALGTAEGAAEVSEVWFFSTFSQVTEPQVSLTHLTSPLWHAHAVQAFFFHCSPCCWKGTWIRLFNSWKITKFLPETWAAYGIWWLLLHVYIR